MIIFHGVESQRKMLVGETTNLIDIEKRTGRQLIKNLHRWRKSMNAQMPAINPDYAR
jgi:hypothetical protein